LCENLHAVLKYQQKSRGSGATFGSLD